MKKILIAIDYNPTAENVAKIGYAVAKAFQAEVVLVHVITDPAFYSIPYSPIMGFYGSYADGTEGVVENIKRKLKIFWQLQASTWVTHSFRPRYWKGIPMIQFLQFADEWKADLIVMGSHKHKGLEKLLPDLAVHMVKNSKIPLLTIPSESLT
ncbi:MAG: universal stress protein [Saprospiraceae bacterium]|nr:universal stress protein [Saprospiraceae bacterium]